MSLSSKRALVLKMLQVIRAGRWEYDRSERGWSEPLTLFAKLLRPAVSSLTKLTDRAA